MFRTRTRKLVKQVEGLAAERDRYRKQRDSARKELRQERDHVKALARRLLELQAADEGAAREAYDIAWAARTGEVPA